MSRPLLLVGVVLLLALGWWTLGRTGRAPRASRETASASAVADAPAAAPGPTREAVAPDRAKKADSIERWVEAVLLGLHRLAVPAAYETTPPASLWGFVLDEEGDPVAGAELTLAMGIHWPSNELKGSLISMADGNPVETQRNRRRGTWTGPTTTTTADGSYSFEDVEPRGYTLILAAESPRAARFSGATVRLASGERRRLDFGVPHAWPRLHGSLRTRGDAPAPDGASVRAIGTATPSATAETSVAANGSFMLRLPPGAYVLTAQLAPGEDFRTALGELELGAEDLRRDFRLGGTRLAGTVRRLDRGARLTGTDRYEELWLRSADDDALFRRTWVDREGRFAIEALEPGTYVLDGFPLPVASGVGSLRIDVLPGQVELDVEVDVRAP